MILAHNKNILTYLYKAIENRRIADGSVGYYVGGMKEADLKRSETKKVVIATYSMAAEALDIKTLTTLIMATPKTDVTQSIGRILRAKHTQPLVIDIVDSHDVFKRQFKKREAYYKKEKYKIIGTSNEMYTTTDYEIIYDPDDPKCKSRNNYKSECKSTEEQLKGQCLLNISLNS
jgi:superfamily II DNA or RNA helicase